MITNLCNRNPDKNRKVEQKKRAMPLVLKQHLSHHIGLSLMRAILVMSPSYMFQGADKPSLAGPGRDEQEFVC